MSHQVLDEAPPIQRPRTGMTAADLHVADLHVAVELEPASALRYRRRPRAALVITALTLALAAGLAAGVSRRDAGADPQTPLRVVLWPVGASPDALPLIGNTPTSVQVSVLATGPDLILEGIRLAAVRGVPARPTLLTSGRRTTIAVQLLPECNAGPLDGSAATAAGPSAVIRRWGSATSQEVPLDLVSDSSALFFSLTAPCSSGYSALPATGSSSTTVAGSPVAGGSPAAGGGQWNDPADSAITISRLIAHRDGTLELTVRAGTSAATRFGLTLVTATAKTGKRREPTFSMQSDPKLPVNVTAGKPRRVTIRFSYPCRGGNTSLSDLFGAVQPDARVVNSPDPIAISGWDDAVVASALAAAAGAACG